MKIGAHGLQLSPTDMANHVACRHLSVLNLAVAHGRLAQPERTAWLPASLQQRGEAHERAYVEHLRSEHLHIVDLRDCRFDADGFNATQEALQRRADVVLQAPLTADRGVGRADVLRRVGRHSALGSWSYEPLDTKLARETRGSAILQLCAYAEMLGAVQGVRPEWMHVVAPGRPFSQQTFRVDDFFAYYSHVRRRLLTFIHDDAPDARTYPEPTAHCEICRWMFDCNRRRRQDDHLSFVANIRALQIAELETWDVTTLAALGSAAVSFVKTAPRASGATLEKAPGQTRRPPEVRQTPR